MKKSVAELEGNELDYWAAKAEGLSPEIEDDGVWIYNRSISTETRPTYYESDTSLSYVKTIAYQFNATVNWEQAGPIIERELISLEPMTKDSWSADKWMKNDELIARYGATPLVAAMRVFVVSKFGKYVEIE